MACLAFYLNELHFAPCDRNVCSLVRAEPVRELVDLVVCGYMVQACACSTLILNKTSSRALVFDDYLSPHLYRVDDAS